MMAATMISARISKRQVFVATQSKEAGNEVEGQDDREVSSESYFDCMWYDRHESCHTSAVSNMMHLVLPGVAKVAWHVLLG